MTEETQEAQQEDTRYVDPSSGAASQPGAAIVGDKPSAAYDDEADLTVAPGWKDTGFENPLEPTEESEESEESDDDEESEEDDESDSEGEPEPEPEPEPESEPEPEQQSSEPLTEEQQETLAGLNYRELQEEAQAAGIPANQSKEQLARALGKL